MSDSTVRLLQLTMLGAGLFLSCQVCAHDARPLYIELTEQQNQVYQLGWKAPPSLALDNLPRIGLQPDCQRLGRATPIPSPSTRTRQQQHWWQCQSPPGQITFGYPQATPALTRLVRIQYLDERSASLSAAPGNDALPLPTQHSTGVLVWQYLSLGWQHIWAGLDHLLFLLCLFALTTNWQRLLLAISAFTATHSITLALAVTGTIRLASAPVEAAIALSVVFMAAELLRRPTTTAPSLIQRYPALAAGAFGLLHGLGFASVLRSIGVPTGDTLPALLGFNLGVELGQIAFMLPLLVVRAVLASNIPSTWRSTGSRSLYYAVGLVGSWWTLTRILSFN